MTTDQESIPTKRLAVAGLLAWLLPGLGHLYLGRRFKGIAYFVIINGLFLSGWAMSKGEAMSLYEEDGHRYAFIAEVGAGGPTVASLVYTHWDDLENRWQQDWLAQSIRLRLDATRDPDYIAQLPWIDAGLLYCMVAGLLNLLVVYEAATGGKGIIDPAGQGSGTTDTATAAPEAAPPAAPETAAGDKKPVEIKEVADAGASELSGAEASEAKPAGSDAQ